VVALVACGGEEEGPAMARGGGDGGAPAKQEQTTAAQAKPTSSNTEWDKVKPYFLGMKNDPNVRPFAQAPLQSVPDPFQDQIVKFVPKPDPLPEELAPPTKTEGGEPVDEPIVDPGTTVEIKGELERFAVRDYTLSLIRWGTSLNKAIVTDPNGQAFIVVKDMKLGNNNGRITDITEYRLIVEEDDRDEPIELSLMPPLLRINTKSKEATDRLFTSQVSID
jgi:Tfp pilus assembly protein PilP